MEAAPCGDIGPEPSVCHTATVALPLPKGQSFCVKACKASPSSVHRASMPMESTRYESSATHSDLPAQGLDLLQGPVPAQRLRSNARLIHQAHGLVGSFPSRPVARQTQDGAKFPAHCTLSARSIKCTEVAVFRLAGLPVPLVSPAGSAPNLCRTPEFLSVGDTLHEFVVQPIAAERHQHLAPGHVVSMQQFGNGKPIRPFVLGM